MLQHAMSGVEQGKAQGGVPVEVMGLMSGRYEGNRFVVLDSYPLPVQVAMPPPICTVRRRNHVFSFSFLSRSQGVETSVVADNAKVMEYMAQLSDSMDTKGPERLIGWYHSHPFDVDGTSHCYMSATDVGTQWQWQWQLKTWFALVIDPLRSVARQEPDMQSFICYPPSHNPAAGEGPDGAFTDDATNQTRWGHAHKRYYRMETSYFMSDLGSNLLSILARDHLWIRNLSAASITEQEARAAIPQRVGTIIKQVNASESAMAASRHGADLASKVRAPTFFYCACCSRTGLAIMQTSAFFCEWCFRARKRHLARQ
jgi:COP9 signalosome complex subunit 5